MNTVCTLSVKNYSTLSSHNDLDDLNFEAADDDKRINLLIYNRLQDKYDGRNVNYLNSSCSHSSGKLIKVNKNSQSHKLLLDILKDTDKKKFNNNTKIQFLLCSGHSSSIKYYSRKQIKKFVDKGLNINTYDTFIQVKAREGRGFQEYGPGYVKDLNIFSEKVLVKFTCGGSQLVHLDYISQNVKLMSATKKLKIIESNMLEYTFNIDDYCVFNKIFINNAISSDENILVKASSGRTSMKEFPKKIGSEYIYEDVYLKILNINNMHKLSCTSFKKIIINTAGSISNDAVLEHVQTNNTQSFKKSFECTLWEKVKEDYLKDILTITRDVQGLNHIFYYKCTHEDCDFSWVESNCGSTKEGSIKVAYLNRQIPAANHISGINGEQSLQQQQLSFMWPMHKTTRLRIMEKKIKPAIKTVFERFLEDNRKKISDSSTATMEICINGVPIVLPALDMATFDAGFSHRDQSAKGRASGACFSGFDFKTKKLFALMIYSNYCGKCVLAHSKGNIGGCGKENCNNNLKASYIGSAESVGAMDVAKLQLNHLKFCIPHICTDGDNKTRKMMDLFSQFEVDKTPCSSHASKCLSGNLIKAADFLKISNIMTPGRAKAIAMEVLINVRKLGKFKIHSEEGTEIFDSDLQSFNDEFSIAVKLCVENVDNIIDHHCGDHKKCNAEWCGWQETRLNNPDKEEYQINNSYVPRFVNLDINNDERAHLKKVISTAITDESAIGLSKNITTNQNENAHARMNKFTSGKRLFLNRTDTWATCVMMGFMQSTAFQFESKILDAIGIKKEDNVILNSYLNNYQKTLEYVRGKNNSDRYKKVRNLKRQKLSAIQLQNAKNLNNISVPVYKTNSDPMGETRTVNDTLNTTKKKNTCSNCNSNNHNTRSCPRKKFKPKKVLTKKRKRILLEDESPINFYADLKN